MQRAWKENFRGGNIKHGSPEAERGMSFLGTQEECVCDGSSKREESNTARLQSVGTRAGKMLLKNWGFVLKDGKKLLKGFKQGKGMT